jgi:hypothetical protein
MIFVIVLPQHPLASATRAYTKQAADRIVWHCATASQIKPNVVIFIILGDAGCSMVSNLIYSPLAIAGLANLAVSINRLKARQAE